MLALWLLLVPTSEIVSPADISPTIAEVAARQEERGGSCVMFTSGVCICTEYQPTIDQLACNRSDDPHSFVCSYNVIWIDTAGIEGRYVEQRMDLFRKGSEGWSRSEFRPPSILPS